MVFDDLVGILDGGISELYTMFIRSVLAFWYLIWSGPRTNGLGCLFTIVNINGQSILIFDFIFIRHISCESCYLVLLLLIQVQVC